MNRTKILKKIKTKAAGAGADGFFSLNRENVNYLSGFSGSSGAVFLTGGKNYLITDFRYAEQAEKQAPGFIIFAGQGKTVKKIKEIALREKIKSIAFEPENLSHSFYEDLKKSLAPMRLVSGGGWVLRLRAIKSGREIDKIAAACSAADRGMKHIKGFIKPGVREIDLEAELFYYLKTVEKAGFSFPPIIISGEKTSLPHGRPSEKKICGKDMVLIDFGVRLRGYCSDLTRTFCVGRMSEEEKHLYKAVLNCQSACIDRIRPGEEAGGLFNFSRSLLRAEGYDLQHGLGHGVGLQVHELPSVSGGARARLREGMVLTVEPGAYLKGRFGVRIEDIVLVKAGGVEILTKTPRRRNEI